MKDVIQIEDRHYILADSSRIDDRTRVLKQEDTFAVFDRFGDIDAVGVGELGLYHDQTRFLSRFSLAFGLERPLLLSSTVREDNQLFAVDLTNPDLVADGTAIPHGTVHVGRETLLWPGLCCQRLRISNYGLEPVRISLALRLDADYADIFEVRGTPRARSGTRLGTELRERGLVLGYQGRDGVIRRTHLECTPPPTERADGLLRFEIALGPRCHQVILIQIACERGGIRPEAEPFHELLRRAAAKVAGAMPFRFHTSSEPFNRWLARSLADLAMMCTETPHGPYPYAGVPWFSAPFGRDGILTALQMLWLDPGVARGVLAHLAATQADRYDDAHDAQPGRILHEARGGEMAALGEVPFGCYYGSVDATPLFVLLAGAYLRRSGDGEFVRSIGPAIERALRWMETDGDPDGDGFLEYSRRSPDGLVHQGWKDSHDSVFHEDGSPAPGPIALCEVQGYAYAAWRAGAALALYHHDAARAEALRARARRLKRRFDEAFWCDAIATYAIAIDGAKRPCRVRTSNPGHCLFTGIVPRARAAPLAWTLLAPESFTGWGVRTVASTEARYNPMSYHNGSVWPHDNALIAAGLDRYGFKNAARRVLDALFAASRYVELHRLPELYCGFDRRPGEGPTLYPVACAPQAWAAGAPLMLLQACLGITVHGDRRRVFLRRPRLPAGVHELVIEGLRIGDAVLDLAVRGHGREVGIIPQRRTGRIRVQVLK